MFVIAIIRNPPTHMSPSLKKYETTEIGSTGYSIVHEKTMTASVVGNKISFKGYATAGTIAGESNAISGIQSGTFSGLFTGESLWSAVTLSKTGWSTATSGSQITIVQKNAALKEAYPAPAENSGIVGDTKTKQYTMGLSDYGYAFLIPKYSNDEVTVTVYTDATKTKVEQTFTFDFSEVSTKIVLGTSSLNGTGWAYKTGTPTLAFTNYTGKEIFSTAAGLTITLTGENKISAYGVANSYAGSAIYAGNALAISGNNSADASLKVTQNTAGAYGIVSYSDSMTIGSNDNNVKKVTLTVDGKPNRAIYAVGGLIVNTRQLMLSRPRRPLGPTMR